MTDDPIVRLYPPCVACGSRGRTMRLGELLCACRLPAGTTALPTRPPHHRAEDHHHQQHRRHGSMTTEPKQQLLDTIRQARANGLNPAHDQMMQVLALDITALNYGEARRLHEWITSDGRTHLAPVTTYHAKAIKVLARSRSGRDDDLSRGNGKPPAQHAHRPRTALTAALQARGIR